MGDGHAVAGMAGAQRLDVRHQRIEIVQAADRRGDHRHQLGLLVLQILGKHRTQLRRDLEQAVVEQVGGGVLDRQNLREARAHQGNIVGGQHFKSSR